MPRPAVPTKAQIREAAIAQATLLHWQPDAILTFVYELLTDANLHEEAAYFEKFAASAEDVS